MQTLRAAQSGDDIRVRLVVTKRDEYLILIENAAIGLHAVGADMRTRDLVEAYRLFDRVVNLANKGLKHPAWKPARTINITQGN